MSGVGTSPAQLPRRGDAARDAAREVLLHAGRATAPMVGRLAWRHRLEPTFLIAGAQRCGTTSLFKALRAHPAVTVPRFHKGVHYFDVGYLHGPAWYRAHFPLRARAARAASTVGAPPQTGESSPYYLHHPLAAGRIAAELPRVRVIVLVRDPVERALSAHRHERARGYETLGFEEALDAEPARLAGEEERLLADPAYRSFAHQHHAYLARGRYAAQVRRLGDALGPGRVLVVESERFFSDGPAVYAEVLDFLGLPPWQPERFDRHNARPGDPVPAWLRRRLDDHFAGPDFELADLLGRVPAWRR